MNKAQLHQALNECPDFDADRLSSLSQGKLTNAVLFSYLCELNGWRPLEVVTSTNPNWVLVASTSEIGLWHRTSTVHQACDCPFSEYHSTPCCHLSAAMAHEENEWIARANKKGFKLAWESVSYCITDFVTKQHVGQLRFEEGRSEWRLNHIARHDILYFKGVDEAIEYLAGVASFGSQLA